MLTEADLENQIKLAQRGDQAAMSLLIRETQARVYRFCLLLCHDPALAQDLVQETYVRALQEIRKLKETKKFAGWLFRIARNLFLDHVKSPKNQPQGQDPAPIIEQIEDPRDAEFSLHLRATLHALKPDDRALLLLIDLEEHSYAEAAEIIGLSESTVRFRLHHIRREFMDKYKK